MPKMQDAHIDRALTNISVAYLQDASAFIADKVFPIVPVKLKAHVIPALRFGLPGARAAGLFLPLLRVTEDSPADIMQIYSA